MKRVIIILTIILVLINVLIFKTKNNKKEIKLDTNVTYPFYKEELKNAYQEYQKKINLSYKQTIINVNIGLNKPFYTNTEEVTNPNAITVLVNKYHYLKKDFIPQNLVKIKNNLYLNKEAYMHYLKMQKALAKEGLKIRIISAYRSYDYQNNLYNSYLKKDSQAIVDTYSARPGYSEHQTGLAIDIDNETLNYNQFHLTKEYHWMQENAHKFGFILRYPLGKEYITGYKYEPWHYRYVGKIAQDIYKQNLTLEEYYAIYR